LKLLFTNFENTHSNGLSTYRTSIVVPRKGYKSITVKDEPYGHFLRAIKEVKKKDKAMDNSKFLSLLLNHHKKGRK
jgi:hypothetical protein